MSIAAKPSGERTSQVPNLAPARFWAALVAGVGLAAGSLIYLSYRPHSLLFFDWIDRLGFQEPAEDLRRIFSVLWVPPRWIVNCAPGGLWIFSGALAMRAIWGSMATRMARFWFFSVPAIGLASEVLQLSGLPGTFDIADLMSYALGTLAAMPFFREWRNE